MSSGVPMKAIEITHKPYTIKNLVRPLVRLTLSPTNLKVIRFQWWRLSSYLPRLLTCWFVKRTPQMWSYGAPLTSTHVAKRLEKLNAWTPTRLCRVMTKNGSDKGRAHNYTTAYSALFKDRYDEPLRILEIGLGSNNADVLSNMGEFGIPGASLRGWRELFPRALVYGADVDRRILFHDDRIKTFYCDQLDRSSVRQLWSHPELQDGVDILIEDGLHTFEANVSFLEESLHHLRPGGVYICEDIMSDVIDKWRERLETVYAKQYSTYEFAFVVLRDGGNQANNLLVVRRGAA